VDRALYHADVTPEHSMQTRLVSTSTLRLLIAAIAVSACRTTPQPVSVEALDASQSTSVLGHWVLATPIDSSAFAGAEQVDLVLANQTFALTVAYRDRAPLLVSGAVSLAEGGLLTLTPSAASPDAAAVGFASGRPFTRVVTASGSTLMLAPPAATVPLPSSVWVRRDAARIAGVAR
jgi:hypothetical protein